MLCRDKWYLIIFFLLVNLSLSGCADGNGGEAPTANHPPLAVAGSDQTVSLASVVKLNGTQSYDPDWDSLTYKWVIAAKPSGSSADLSLSNSPTPILITDKDGDYLVQLTVNDGLCNSRPVSIKITAKSAKGILDTSFGNDSNPTDGVLDGFVAHDNAAGGFGSDMGHSMVLDSKGRIYVAGNSRSSAGSNSYDMVIWRFTDRGSLDTTFGNGKGFVRHNGAAGGISYDEGRSIALDKDGRLYVAGYGSNPNNYQDMAIWRYTSDGIIDTTFGGDVNPADGIPDGFVVHNYGGGNYPSTGANAIYLDPAGRIYVTGYITEQAGGNMSMVIWRYTANGSVDSSFGGGSGHVIHKSSSDWRISSGNSLIVDQDGLIYVTGTYYHYTLHDTYMFIWRYTSDGTLDTAFGGGSGFVAYCGAAGSSYFDKANSIILDQSGRIYVAGYSWNAEGGYGNLDMVVWRYNSNSGLDTDFGGGDGLVVHNNAAGGILKNDVGLSLALDPAGRVYVSGYSYSTSGDYEMVVWRYTSNGVLDTSFGEGKGFVVHDSTAAGNPPGSSGDAIALDKEGRVMVAGYSKNLSGNYDMTIWRYE